MDGRTLDLSRLRATLELLKEPTRDWTEEDLVMHLRDWRRNNANEHSTIPQRIRDLRRMARHPMCPVKLHGTRYELVNSFYQFMRYRETVEKKAPTAIANDFKAVLALGDFVGVPREVWPRPPSVPKRAKPPLPPPEEIHALLHADYAKNPKHNYENFLVKYALVLDYGFGIRWPSEAFALRVQDFDPKAHTLLVTEPKKGHRTRRVYIEPEWLCCGSSRASLAQFLRWRKKVDVGGTDAFFLKPNGEPFESKLTLSKFVKDRVKARFPNFKGYDGRRWNANARLIDWDFDFARAADWLGHESVNTLRHDYENESRLHAKRYGGNWIERAFKGPMKPKSPKTRGPSTVSPSLAKDAPGTEQPGLGSGQVPIEGPQGGVSGPNSPYGISAPAGI